MILLSCVEINPLFASSMCKCRRKCPFYCVYICWIAKTSYWQVYYDVGCTISKRVLRYLAKAVLDDSTASNIIWSSSAGETLNDSLSTSSLLVGDLANSAGNRGDTGSGVALVTSVVDSVVGVCLSESFFPLNHRSALTNRSPS